MKLTVEEALRMWEDNSLGFSSHEEQLKSNILWMNYWDKLADQFSDYENMPKGKYPVLYDLIKKNINIDSIKTVLDIGAGCGDYSLLFANDGKNVMAIDMSKNSLEVLNKRAIKHNLDGLIETRNDLWENISENLKYDVVFSSMCPGVCDPAAILKMERQANKYCILILKGKGESSPFRKELMNRVLDKRPIGLLSDAIYPFNYLYALGKNPMMITKSFEVSNKRSAKSTIDNYISYFKIWNLDESVTRPIITEYVNECMQDGFIEDNSLMNNAIIIWKI